MRIIVKFASSEEKLYEGDSATLVEPLFLLYKRTSGKKILLRRLSSGTSGLGSASKRQPGSWQRQSGLA